MSKSLNTVIVKNTKYQIPPQCNQVLENLIQKYQLVNKLIKLNNLKEIIESSMTLI